MACLIVAIVIALKSAGMHLWTELVLALGPAGRSRKGSLPFVPEFQAAPKALQSQNEQSTQLSPGLRLSDLAGKQNRQRRMIASGLDSESEDYGLGWRAPRLRRYLSHVARGFWL